MRALTLTILACLYVANSPSWLMASEPETKLPPPWPLPRVAESARDDSQQVLISLAPGESREVVLCWQDVPSGRLPTLAINELRDMTFQERLGAPLEHRFEVHGLIITVNEKRSDELSQKLMTAGKNCVIAALRITAPDRAPTGHAEIYVHYLAGTGRTIYRRGTLQVLIDQQQAFKD